MCALLCDVNDGVKAVFAVWMDRQPSHAMNRMGEAAPNFV